MTWEIIAGLIAFVGFIISIGKIVSNNTQALTEVKCSIDDLLYNGNINHFKNKTRYVNMVIEIELYKQQFYKALYTE